MFQSEKTGLLSSPIGQIKGRKVLFSNRLLHPGFGAVKLGLSLIKDGFAPTFKP